LNCAGNVGLSKRKRQYICLVQGYIYLYLSFYLLLPMSPFRSNMTGKSLAFSGVGKWLQSGRMRAYLIVLESTEPHKFSDATYVWKKSTDTFAIS
jgi:hypothetical protein